MNSKPSFNRKQTFWNDLRVKNGYKLEDLADAFGTSLSNVGKWFSGKYVPNDAKIHDICDLFGVDFEKGKAEFINARSAWHSDKHQTKHKNAPCTESVCVDDKCASTKLPDNSSCKINSKKDLFRYLYGNISFDDYERLRENPDDTGNLLELVYGIVSFDVFDELYNQLHSKA